jgi:hypothetical protein
MTSRIYHINIIKFLKEFFYFFTNLVVLYKNLNLFDKYNIESSLKRLKSKSKLVFSPPGIDSNSSQIAMCQLGKCFLNKSDLNLLNPVANVIKLFTALRYAFS